MNHGWLAQLDPRLKLAAVASVSTLAVIVDSVPALMLLLLPGLLGLAWLPLPPRVKSGIALVAAAVWWSAVFTQGFFFQVPEPTVWFTLLEPADTWLGRFPGLMLTAEGVHNGLLQGSRLVATVLMGVAAAVSTSPHRLLAALVSLGAPAWLSFVVMTALRFLPMLAADWQQVHRARWLRGARQPWWRHPPTAVAAEFALLQPLFSATLRRAATLATSITIRGFDPLAPRTLYPPPRMTSIERTAAALLVLGTLALVVLKSTLWPGL